MEPTTMAAIASAVGQFAQAKLNQRSQNSAMSASSKRQFLQNLYMQDRQIEWEKERALNAHQWEAQDLIKAGFNPALTATGGQGANTGSISAPTSSLSEMQGLNMGNFGDFISQLVEMKNNTKATNANANLADAQAMKTITENRFIPQQIKNETMNAISNRITANANQTNAITNREVGKATAKYTNERSRGYTRTRSGSGSIGWKGGSGSYMESNTY